MKVTNLTSFDIIAFGWHESTGYGDDVHIPPGQTADVNGPYLGEMDGGSCHVALAGEVTCHEAPDDDKAFQVTQGNPLSMASGDCGFTIRHHDDPPEDHVVAWREANPSPEPEKVID